MKGSAAGPPRALEGEDPMDGRESLRVFGLCAAAHLNPVVLLNCSSGKNMLSKFNDEQLEMIYHVIMPEHWAMRFRKLSKDVELAKQVAKESNL